MSTATTPQNLVKYPQTVMTQITLRY